MSKFDQTGFGTATNHFGTGHEHDHAETALTINEGTDASASTSTIYSMNVGDTFSGTISTTYDSDWVAITLTSGQSIEISVTGVGLNNPYAKIYTPSGQFLASDYDSGPGNDAKLTYTTSYGGTFYVAADAFSPDTGTYEMSVKTWAGPAPSDPLDSIDWGTKLYSKTVDVYFGSAGFSADGVTSEGFNAYQKAQFMAVFDLLESVSGLKFNIVTSVYSQYTADFRLIMDSNELPGGLYGYMNPPGYGGTNSGVGVFNQNQIDAVAGGNMDKGGLGWYVIIHELMHGLGLAHPHDTGGSSDVMDGVSNSGDTGDYDLNQGIYTAMSYTADFAAGPLGTSGDPGDNWGMAGGPMALDIAVLQAKYGANTTHNSGANTYTLGDVHGAGAHWQAIWDTGSTDTMRYLGGRDATLDLRAATLVDGLNGGGYVSAVVGVAGGFTIANGVVIENASGGAGNDAIYGNTADNRLTGGNGNDTMTGYQGDDTLSGQNGADLLVGGQGEDLIYGGAGNDNIRGGDGEDSIYGGHGADYIQGGNGSDVIYGGAGVNKLFGQRGEDTLIGGDNNDTLNSGGGADFMKGAKGNDWFRAGNSNDTLWGGDGRDTMFGNSEDDILLGGAGNDRLNGGGGNDTLQGGSGDDFLKGGVGADTFVFEAGMGADDILSYSSADDTLRLNRNLLEGETTGAQVVNTYAAVVGSHVVFDFGDGDTITLLWTQTLDGLADDILIV